MKENKGLVRFGLFAYFVIQLVVGAVIGGFVFAKLWQWFVVPTFGFSSISIVQAIGIGSLVGYLTHQNIPQKEGRKTTEVIASTIGETVVYPFIVLAFGWVVVQFM